MLRKSRFLFSGSFSKPSLQGCTQFILCPACVYVWVHHNPSAVPRTWPRGTSQGFHWLTSQASQGPKASIPSSVSAMCA